MDSTALALTLAGFGVLLIALSYQRHLHQRTVSALAHGIGGAGLFLAAMLLLALTLNFNTYDELKAEQPLAELSVEQISPQTFSVSLMRIPAGDLQVFTLNGNRWQLEARVLNWHGRSRWLGLDANIRLEHLLSSNQQTADQTHNRYVLNRTPGIRLVRLQQAYPRLLDFLSSHTLMTEPMPLENALRFQIYFNQGQLLARAINRPNAPKPRSAVAPVISYRGLKEAINQGNNDTTDADIDPAAPADESTSNTIEALDQKTSTTP